MVTSGERSANSTRGLHGRWLAVALSVSLSLGTASPASQDVADEGGEAVATVGDIVLSRVELERNEKRLGFFGTLDGVPADKRRARALRHLVEDTLLAAEAQRRGIEVGESTIDDALAELVQVLSGRNQSLDRMFAATGLDRESLREQARRDIAVQLLFSELLTPEEYDAVYEARHREFDGTRYRVSHLVLRPDGTGNASALVPEARRIRAGIVAGEITFAAAAARHSAAPSRRRGGDIGFIPRHGPFAEEFARAAFALEKGEVSEPVVSPFGVHLITVTDIDPGTAGPEKVRPAIERLARETIRSRLLEECRERMPVSLATGVEMEASGEEPADRR